MGGWVGETDREWASGRDHETVSQSLTALTARQTDSLTDRPHYCLPHSLEVAAGLEVPADAGGGGGGGGSQ